LEKIWQQHIYEGGRVTQRLRSIFYYESHRRIFRWLRAFTYLLHGDQGATLGFWKKIPSLFSGYAIEISLLYQALADKSLQDQILNIEGLPHSHQRSKSLNIWKMSDCILLSLDVLRIIYGDLDIREFLLKYRALRTFTMQTRFGNMLLHTPEIKGLSVYPSLSRLKIS
jgi:hypothetical protein